MKSSHSGYGRPVRETQNPRTEKKHEPQRFRIDCRDDKGACYQPRRSQASSRGLRLHTPDHECQLQARTIPRSVRGGPCLRQLNTESDSRNWSLSQLQSHNLSRASATPIDIAEATNKSR